MSFFILLIVLLWGILIYHLILFSFWILHFTLKIMYSPFYYDIFTPFYSLFIVLIFNPNYNVFNFSIVLSAVLLNSFIWAISVNESCVSCILSLIVFFSSLVPTSLTSNAFYSARPMKDRPQMLGNKELCTGPQRARMLGRRRTGFSHPFLAPLINPQGNHPVISSG